MGVETITLNLDSFSYDDNPIQWKLINEWEKRIIAGIGGIGWGKTSGTAVHYLMAASNYPGSTGIVITPTYVMLEDTLLPEIFKWSHGIRKFYHQTKHRLELLNGSQILFRVGETKKQIERLRGPNITWTGLEEAALLSKKVYDIMMGRLREDDWGQCILSTTPKGRNWIYDLIQNKQRKIERCRYNLRTDIGLDKTICEVIRYIGDDLIAYTNIPTFLNKTLPISYLQSLLKEYAGKFARQELWGEFISMAGLVYENFNPDLHILQRVKRIPLERYGVVDWGFSSECCIHVYGIDEQGRLTCEDEIYRTRMTADDVGDEILDFQEQYTDPPIQRVLCDPADPSSIETLRRKGINAEPANNDLIGGIKTVDAWMKNNLIYTLNHCQGFINESGLYSYPEDSLSEKPLDKYNHAMDCLRYMVNYLVTFGGKVAVGSTGGLFRKQTRKGRYTLYG